jgi:hypothetical protein
LEIFQLARSLIEGDGFTASAKPIGSSQQAIGEV